ncbi:MAG TPA: large conductance mechanosensitive channel protein MscL [Chitinophagaceae bacterium]
MSFAKEFREFAVRGNVVDLAVGVIIGAAFNKIVESIVGDLVMPLIGVFFNADFSNLYIPLSDEVKQGLTLEQARAAGPVFAWGNFVTVLINFIILAFVIFWLVKGINVLRRKQAAKEETEVRAPTTSEKLLEEIRDAIKAKGV